MRINYIAAMGSVVPPPPVLIDSYSESNQDDFLTFQNTNLIGVGQCFTAVGATLGSCRFYILGVAGLSPTGNAFAKLYAIANTFGTTAIPTGSALATSDAFDTSTLTSSFALVTFTFSGANQYSLVNGTHYFITLEYNGGSLAHQVSIGMDATSPSHAGNSATQAPNSTWTAFSKDVCFYVYGT